MKKILSIVAALSLFTNVAVADCDFSKVVKNSDGTFTYTKELHICVGQLVQDNTTKDLQIKDYLQAITLKDLAITTADKRTQLWMDTTFKLEDNIQKMDSFKSTSNWIYFGLGALTIIGAGMMAAQLTHR